MARAYPGWRMRVYHDGAEDDFEAVREMCGVWCDNDHVDFCDVNALPRPFGNLKSLMPVGELHSMLEERLAQKSNGKSFCGFRCIT